MIQNQNKLLELKPIENMLNHKERTAVCSHGLAEVGYDVTIKQDIIFKRNIVTGLMEVQVDDGFIDLGRHVLASTREKFQMPNNLVGFVFNKSTWSRQGLHVAASVIEPGWSGHLTLSLMYAGKDELVIPAGSGIAQIIFSDIAVPHAYTGKYQNQEDKPTEAIAG